MIVSFSGDLHMQKLSALYYPFSRCVNPASMKQMLLVFDELAFLDPVDDDGWRKHLFQDLVRHDVKFSQYQEIDPALPALVDGGCIKRVDPGPFVHQNQSLATASALSDLQDPAWVKLASNPTKFHMPSIAIRGKDSWQVFRPKLPGDFISSLRSVPELRPHLIEEGTDSLSWSLSYAAGSAIGIGLHLEMAERLGAAPVTDSGLHHRLLLLKVSRAAGGSNGASPIPEEAVQRLSADIASTMIRHVLPEELFSQITFDEIIAFRSQTESLRRDFLNEIEFRLGQLRTVPNAEEWVVAGKQIIAGLQGEFRNYQAEFTANRDKIWPGLVSTMNNALVSGGLGAVAMSYIGGPGKALIGSLVGASIGFLKTALEWQVDGRKLLNSSAPSIAYLSRVASQLK